MKDNVALAYVFGLGMVAVFNPCGFAMLPAWIAYFLAVDDDEEAPSVVRAIAIGATLTAGFVSVFLVIGLILQLTAANLVARLPWLSIVLGVGMVGLAVSLLLGRDLKVSLPWVPRGPRTRTFRAVFVFGVSYAFVSLACTIPLFLAAVTTSMTGGSLGVGLAHFVAYALGMGVILTVLTVALSLARASFVSRLRRVVPHVRRIAAVLLGVAGVYVAYYGWYSLQVYDGNLDAGGPAKVTYDLSARVSQLVIDTGPVRIGAVAVAAVALAFLISFVPKLKSGRPAPDRSRADAAPGDRVRASAPASDLSAVGAPDDGPAGRQP
jgi:cytochrome c-type biogenesis protein